MVFAIHDLCLHPEYVEPLRNELKSQYHDFAASGRGLPLLDSFIKESTRLTPVESSKSPDFTQAVTSVPVALWGDPFAFFSLICLLLGINSIYYSTARIPPCSDCLVSENAPPRSEAL